MLIRHRTTARSILLAFLVAGTLAGPSAASAAVPKLAFPVVGPVSYQDDFGDPRGSGSHQGNDIMGKRRQPVVAAEPGRVTIYRGSSRAGCMLYLYGVSGTVYYYIHLNDDLTTRDDNGATDCRTGVAYAPGLKSGQQVRAGHLIGFVGNSGDARGIQPHLHFEVHPNGGRAVNPFRHLNDADRLLFARPIAVEQVKLDLQGTVVKTTEETFSMKVHRVGVATTKARTSKRWLGRTITLAHTAETVWKRKLADGTMVPASTAKAKPGERVTIWTPWFKPLLRTQRAGPGVLTAERVLLRGFPD
jgi:Peptidase family M23